MSRCVGHCERTAAPRILPFVRFGMAYRLHFVTLTRQIGFRLTSHFSFLCILFFFFFIRETDFRTVKRESADLVLEPTVSLYEDTLERVAYYEFV